MKNTQQEIDRAVRAAARAIDYVRHNGLAGQSERFHARDALVMYGVEPTRELINRAQRQAAAMPQRSKRTPSKRPMSSIYAPRRPAAR
ncbi:hypothetical protein [Halofilum ochraceum]|uniref:hypothetical protein n=1 Tax=Halofilum ochraceum TaxID=1611323 RepID=UPI0008DA2D6F|nr:hypothetical protein [Halofilum ochraceum]